MSAPQGAGPSALLLGLLSSVPSTTRTPAPDQGEEGRGTARPPSSGPHWLPQAHPDEQHPLGSWPGPGSGWGAPVYGGEGLAITLGSLTGTDPALSHGPTVCTEPSFRATKSHLWWSVHTRPCWICTAPWSWGAFPWGRRASWCSLRQDPTN